MVQRPKTTQLFFSIVQTFWKQISSTFQSMDACQCWFFLQNKIGFTWMERCSIEYNFTIFKGQLISKCLFGVFTFFQKTNENKSTSSKVEFVRSFFGRNVGLKKSFRICLTFRPWRPCVYFTKQNQQPFKKQYKILGEKSW